LLLVEGGRKRRRGRSRRGKGKERGEMEREGLTDYTNRKEKTCRQVTC